MLVQIRLDISCEASLIHMKYKVLFSLKMKKAGSKLAEVVIGYSVKCTPDSCSCLMLNFAFQGLIICKLPKPLFAHKSRK